MELEKKISVKEYKENHQEDIDIINKAVNNEDMITKAIDRFILVGKFYDSVDAIIYGSIDDFLWITKKRNL